MAKRRLIEARRVGKDRIEVDFDGGESTLFLSNEDANTLIIELMEMLLNT